ncbi:site-2 protease family protein [Haloechinothrix sp. LS1_15]|uniref:M50 family metallopeptidase n=1 Tax=Haloechinothrix sp. LS1_15 TaxID=2652248 RepID=UPI00294624D1|nr:site-2 protease family protein [Haloechinothrix sp. LS1_15]MDV6012784.1 site-2 protease family protein [Haloechinothrix sp. LS1_15]
MLAYIIGVVLFALAICVSIALHEAGHMWTAKKFGMKVRRFFVGFGPTLYSFRRGETEYGVKAIPLGGFCDIAGMTALDEVKPEESKRAMWRYPVWKRTTVLAAGSAMHFLIGFIVLLVMAGSLGLPNLDGKPEVAGVSDCVRDVETREQLENFDDLECRPGDPAPAMDANLMSGDVITSVDGRAVENIVEATELVQERQGWVPVTLDRDGTTIQTSIDVARVERPNLDEEAVEQGAPATVEVGMIGVEFVQYHQYNAVEAAPATVVFTGEMFERTWHALLRLPERMPAVVEAITGAERDPDTPISVVGASRIGGETVQHGMWEVFLLLLAALNFFVGIFNLLPLLPLDGGHIAVTWYERVRDWIRKLFGKSPGGPVDYTKLSAVTMVAIIIGGGVMLLTITADIVNPIRITE